MQEKKLVQCSMSSAPEISSLGFDFAELADDGGIAGVTELLSCGSQHTHL